VSRFLSYYPTTALIDVRVSEPFYELRKVRLKRLISIKLKEKFKKYKIYS
jgi:hypothetical protein